MKQKMNVTVLNERLHMLLIASAHYFDDGGEDFPVGGISFLPYFNYALHQFNEISLGWLFWEVKISWKRKCYRKKEDNR